MVIRIGPAGTGGNSLEGIRRMKELGLDAVEIEFVRGVRMSNELASRISEENRKLGLTLSVHAPYYINLASHEAEKIEASKKRILDSCERAHHMGAECVVFHAAFYGKHTAEECYSLVKEAVIEMQRTIKENRWDVILCPETTGKKSQFGTMEELSRLSAETGCGVCIDFAHIYARNNGSIDYDRTMEQIKGLKHATAHFSGINFNEKGERNHELTSEESVRELFTSLRKHDISITIINESPDPVGDALMMRKIREEKR
ncbi:MAG: TIM barrel protein [Candidatus Woesearchaeota archaeon]